MRQCTPATYGGALPASETTYNDAQLRAVNVLVEAWDDKIPAESTLGSDAALLRVEGAGDGHVPRNVQIGRAHV